MKRLLSALLMICAVRQSAAADFTVTNVSSSGPGSLLQAITDANNTPGADRIIFNVPGSGIHKIDVSQNPLSTVVESLVIDGYTQPGAKPNSLSVGDNAVILIQIDGGTDGLVPAKNGFVFNPNSGNAPSNYTVRGLCLTGFFGTTNGSTYGTAITAGVVDSLVVTGNFIGVLPDGETARANWTGVGHVTQLGGIDPASRNIISGNTVGFSGELATGAGPAAAIVQGNYMGTNASGTKAVPNTGAAISLDSGVTTHCETAQFDLSNTLIGGTTPGLGGGTGGGLSSARNVISGNAAAITLGGVCSLPGIPIARTGVNGVQIVGNVIGVSSDDAYVEPGGTHPVPNGSGITIVGSNNVVTSNVIKFNDSGVIVMSGTSNQISVNMIHLNRRLGIDLGGDGVTANDTNDVDSGPNNLQNFPLITSASVTQADRFGFDWIATVGGTLQSTPNSTFRIELFANFVAGPSGYGEGQLYFGSTNVSTDMNGSASFSITSPVNGFPGDRAFSVTATDSSGNTSEFSPAFFPAAQLLNLSTRTAVGAGENVLIGGFIVAGTEDKKVLLRGLGPSLAQAGVNGVLADPTVELRDATGALIASNDNWRDTQEGEISQTGLAPAKQMEAAILGSLPAKPISQGGAAYTGILAGKNGKAGIGLLEIYDLGAGANSKLTNISTRGFVGAGEGVLIGGLIPGPTDNSAIRVLIRGIGPSLSAHGISSPLADPVLELHDANGRTLVKNDNWSEAFNASEISTTGIQPTDSRESAILIMLLPASGYTAIVRGANGATGVALVEVYALN